MRYRWLVPLCLAILLPLQATAWEIVHVDLEAVPESATPTDLALQSGGVRLGQSFRLTSDDRRFGGISAALWQGKQLLLASDRGTLWRASAVFDSDGSVTSLHDWAVLELRDHRLPQQALDIESLATAGASRIAISIEGQPQLRLLDLTSDDPIMQPLGRSYELPGVGTNGGIEALSDIADGSYLAISESVQLAQGMAAMRVTESGSRPLIYRSTKRFQPTGADRIEQTIFVLERRFGLLSGWQARIAMIDTQALPASDTMPIEPEPIAYLRPPLRLDNLEGIAARRIATSDIALTLLSDDNFNALQETLMLQLLIHGR